MTFLEAAIAILQREGKPLHYKKLTEIALRDNLLTFVGKAPEATMQQKLNDALKTGDPTAPLLRDKPGVFGLRYYPPRRPDQPSEPEPAALASAPVSSTVAPATPEAVAADAPVTAEPSSQQAPAAKAPAADAAGAAGTEEGRRRRRRRGGRGRRRGREGAEETTPGDGVSAAGLDDEDGDEPMSDETAAPSAKPTAARPPRTQRPTAGANASTDAEADGAAGERRPLRTSFADAAAAVAAAHGRPVPEYGRPPESVGESAESTAPGEQAEESEAAARPAKPPAPPITSKAKAAPPAPSVAPSPSEASEPSEPSEPSEEEIEDYGRPSGPLIATAFGTEEMVKGEEHREVVDGRERTRRRRWDRGERDNRERDRRGGGQGQSAHPAHPPHAEPRGQGQAQAQAQGRPVESPRPAPQPAPSAEGGIPQPIDAVLDVLRNSDGRPMHLRQIVELGLKRRVMRGDIGELVRVARAAITIDGRVREAAGLRTRVRATGGSNYHLVDRKLDPDLAQLEREFNDHALRLTEATRGALLRRLQRLAPPAFEALMRVVAGRLGVGNIEFVKRGDGVCYLGGERLRAGQRRRVLIGVRSGDGEVGRRAVGELRAGLKARSYDEGLLLAGGTANAEALEELSATAGAVEMHEGRALSATCLREGVGVVRRVVPVDVLDVELFTDVSEG